MSQGPSSIELGKERRFNQQNQLRKQKRDDLLLKRRGLNFITDQHEMTLDEECIDTMEKEIDNVAPKIIGILGLSESCDIERIRDHLVDQCINHMESLRVVSKKDKNIMEDEIKIDRKLPFQAYICPNAGAANNLNSKKQRLIFMKIDRNDVYSVLDVGKVADLILVVMSCKNSNTSQLTVDPENNSGAIDD